MSVVNEYEPVAAAIIEAQEAGAYRDTSPLEKDGRPIVGPVPLERMLAAKGVARIEVPQLTRAAAAAEFQKWGLDRLDFLSDPTPLAGLLFVTAGGGCVLVRQDDPLPRRRFSAAHELGHFLMHMRPEWLDDEPDALTDDLPEAVIEGALLGNAGDEALTAVREREANRFAAELLMPAAVCRGLYQFYTNRFGETPRFIEGHIAGDLLVSRQAVRYRLRDLGLTEVA
ncbi:MAG TPA: ImmA/IrrE family metallo-endopeptidase [Tepidisphaeraceae bacterium]|jgi:hypothetical protein